MGDSVQMLCNSGRMAAAAVALTLSACATGMSAADCASADWRAFGEADGRAGRKEKFFDHRAEDCRAHGYAVDEAAYATGRHAGLAAYCTKTGGYDAGKAGDEYVGVCPATAEPEFLKGFDLGAALFTMNEKANAARQSYDSAIKDLDQHRFLLKAAEKRASSPTLDLDEREAARQDADYRSGEIARLEREMPQMQAASAEAEKALAAWREKLVELGMEPSPASSSGP